MSGTEPSLAVQKTLRSRLIASSAVTALVTVGNVALDARRPEAMPCIVIGPATVNFMDCFDVFFDEVFCDLHLWTNESGLSSVKEIAGAIRAVIDASVLTIEGFRVVNSKLASARYVRDPDGEHVHGILSVEAIVQATS